jgi:hypothetical protein
LGGCGCVCVWRKRMHTKVKKTTAFGVLRNESGGSRDFAQAQKKVGE